MIHYEGIFFEGESLELIKKLEGMNLGIINDEIHLTFKYKPEDSEIFNEIVGKSFDLYLIGYGNDGKNSGFKILLPKKLLKYYINYDNNHNLKVPHITASIKEGEKASNTMYLDFKPLRKKVKITGKFGYWIKDGENEYLSYEPFIKTKTK